MDKKVGIIGLGIMGGAIAINLLERGWQVFGIDLDAARRGEMAAAGVTICESIAAVSAAAPVLLTSLPSSKAAMIVAREIAAAPDKGRIVVELSTLAMADKLAFADLLAPAGHIPLDCPLSGTGAQAKLRDLVVYASGGAAMIAQLAPLFGDFAKKTASLGAYGNGSRMKFVANLLVAVHNVASAEAMVLGMKAGLDPKDIVDVIGPGAGGSRMFELRAPMMARDSYEPATMRVSTWAKDMAVIGAFARDLGVETPCFDATAPVYDAALAMGLGEADTASVCRVLEAKSGVVR
jgi:L-threonate 2-dehydrogenase